MTTTFISHGGTGERVSFPAALMADETLRLWFDEGPEDTLYAVDESAPWLLRIAWTYTNGRAEATAVDLRGREGQPITPVVWRSIQLGRLLEEARLLLAASAEAREHLFASHGYPEAAKVLSQQTPSTSGTRRGRKADYSIAQYERVAEEYIKALDLQSRTPVKAVAVALTKDPAFAKYPGLTAKGDQRVKGLIARAKKMGLIPGERNKEHG